MIASRSTVAQHIPGDTKAQTRWAQNNASSKRFFFARVKLLATSLPAQLDNILANATEKFCPLVIDANKKGFGTDDYKPKCVVIAGAHQRKLALARGELFAMAWIGEDALKAAGVSQLDGISMDELQQKVTAAINKKYAPTPAQTYPYSDGCCSDSSGPLWVRQLYPFDNYCVFMMSGKNYKQSYTIDLTTREVKLTGGLSEVEQEYVEVNAADDIQAFGCNSPMPYIPLGMYVSPDFLLPSLFTVSYGASNSELRNPQYGEAFLNVDAVVEKYLANVRNGYHSPILPPAAPIPNVQQMFATELRARGVESPADFFMWAAKHKKAVGVGSPVGMDQFAYIGDPKKKSTWKLPIHNANHVRNALSRFDQTEGIPDEKKAGVLAKIHKAAKKFGIDTTESEKENNVTACDDEMDADTSVDDMDVEGKKKVAATGNIFAQVLLGKD